MGVSSIYGPAARAVVLEGLASLSCYPSFDRAMGQVLDAEFKVAHGVLHEDEVRALARSGPAITAAAVRWQCRLFRCADLTTHAELSQGVTHARMRSGYWLRNRPAFDPDPWGSLASS